MRFLLLILLTSCINVARPVDILGPGVMCENINEGMQRCRDREGRLWTCTAEGNGWMCTR